jgi:hypothetical protein
MNVRLVQLDGKYPNLALMKLAHYHKAKGDFVHVTRRIYPELFEPAYDIVYGSAIFDFTAPKLAAFRLQWPNAIVGGTGSGEALTVEQVIGREYEHYDYSGWPLCRVSLGFTQRGCRMAKIAICRRFCVVPEKEGQPRSLNTIAQIWRGEPWPRKLLLLDNDFFGNPDWRARLREIRDGRFKVCFWQGINTRLINEEAAEALASIEYRNSRFSERKLYTAWDNIGDERIFFNGVQRLERAGIPPSKLMAYMLVGCDPEETWTRIWYRFRKMVECGIEPYPMVFRRSREDLLCFQRWVVRGLYRRIPWPDYRRKTKTNESVRGWREIYRAAETNSIVYQVRENHEPDEV